MKTEIITLGLAALIEELNRDCDCERGDVAPIDCELNPLDRWWNWNRDRESETAA
jgi:hypothetical protein